MEKKIVYLSDYRAKNFNDAGATNPCIICGKEVNDEKYLIHLSTDGEIYENTVKEYDVKDSQGYFPIGSSCVKKIPKTHIIFL